MKFRFIIEGDGSKRLMLTPENPGEKDIFKAMLNGDNAVVATISPTWSGDRPPYRTVESLTIQFGAPSE